MIIILLMLLLGGFLDFENRHIGNIRNDIPSTILIIIGIILEIMLFVHFTS